MTVGRGYPWGIMRTMTVMVERRILAVQGAALPHDEQRRDASRGALLCETCFDAFTDRVVTLGGLEQVQCEACAR